jgi:hypothetical protein
MPRLLFAHLAVLFLAPAAEAQVFPRLHARTQATFSFFSARSVCKGPECQASGFVNPIVPAASASFPKPMFAADPQVVGASKLRIAKRIAEFRAGVKAELEKRGVAPEDVAVVGQLGDGKILEWLVSHGPDIIKFVEMLMALFAGGG